jgi:cytochrome b
MAADAAPVGALRVWDPVVRLTHWSIAAAVLLNGLLIDEDAATHVWIGYAAFGVLGLRLAWGLIGPETARFTAFPPSLSAAAAHVSATLAGRPQPPARSHNPLGALMVYALWGLLLAVSVTGVMFDSDAFWRVEAVEEAHEAAANLLMLCAALHVAGVAVESRVSGVNLAKAMVDGIKVFPAKDR